MAKTQQKTAKRKAVVAPGKKKPAQRKAAKASKGAKKAPAKKAPAKKAPAKKAVKKAPPKKAAPKKGAAKAAPKAAPKKAAPKKVAPKKVAPKKVVKAPPPAKKAAAPAPTKKAKAETKPIAEKTEKVVRAAVKAAKEAVKDVTRDVLPPAEPKPKGRPGRPAKQAPPAPAAGPELDAPAALDIPDLEAALGEDGMPVFGAGLGRPGRPGRPGALGGPPKKRGRKRRDPLDDLLKPEKKRGRPGRPRKRGGLAELMPKRPRPRKRIRGRRDDDDSDIPVTPRPPAPRDSQSIEEIQADVLAMYLRGETPACPVGCGGMAQVVRVSTGDNGAGEIWLECLSCAQRERFEVPAPTNAERDAVYATLDAGSEPTCVRHSGRYVPMRRRGRDYVCPDCGILIAGR